MKFDPCTGASPLLRAAMTRKAMQAVRTACRTLAPVGVLLFAGVTHAEDSVSQTMRITKAELATPEGRQAIQARAGAIAARLCRQFRDTRTVDQRETYAACMHDALDMARAQIDAAVAAAQGGPAAPAVAASAPQSAQRVAENRVAPGD